MTSEERNKQLEKEYRDAQRGSAKPMLWIAMVSMTMFFAGLMSAYIITSKRDDWVSFELPTSLFISTAVIVLSSITYILAKQFLKKGNRSTTTVLLIITLILALAFIYFQREGFYELRAQGLYVAGKGSTISASLLMAITFAHILHVFGGLIVLLTVIYNHFKERYNASETLGFELGGIYWHFLDIMWIVLFLFFYFIG